MRLVAGFIAGLLCAVAAAPVLADQGSYPGDDAAIDDAYAALNWSTETGAYKLPRSHAVIHLRGGQALLLGSDAQRYSYLSSGTEFPDTEAVLTYDSASAKAEVYYEWRDEGFVTDTGWADIDPDALLEQYRQGTEDSNSERVSNGVEPMHVAGWLEKPHYDKKTRTVTYAMELTDKNGNWANAFALRLGRGGYTEFTWVGPVGLFRGAGGRPALLNQALASHSYEQGYRYQDYKSGDKLAGYGLAGLIAAAMGAKFGKGLIGALIALVLAGKKIIIPAIAVGGAAALRFARRILGGGGGGETESS